MMTGYFPNLVILPTELIDAAYTREVTRRTKEGTWRGAEDDAALIVYAAR